MLQFTCPLELDVERGAVPLPVIRRSKRVCILYVSVIHCSH